MLVLAALLLACAVPACAKALADTSDATVDVDLRQHDWTVLFSSLPLAYA